MGKIEKFLVNGTGEEFLKEMENLFSDHAKLSMVKMYGEDRDGLAYRIIKYNLGCVNKISFTIHGLGITTNYEDFMKFMKWRWENNHSKGGWIMKVCLNLTDWHLKKAETLINNYLSSFTKEVMIDLSVLTAEE